MNEKTTTVAESVATLTSPKPSPLAAILMPVVIAAAAYLIYTLVTIGVETLRALDALIVYS